MLYTPINFPFQIFSLLALGPPKVQYGVENESKSLVSTMLFSLLDFALDLLSRNVSQHMLWMWKVYRYTICLRCLKRPCSKTRQYDDVVLLHNCMLRLSNQTQHRTLRPNLSIKCFPNFWSQQTFQNARNTGSDIEMTEGTVFTHIQG